MDKLIPHCGRIAQPGKTYYAQIITHHIFSITDASNGLKPVYIENEIVFRDKDSHLTWPFLVDYISAEFPVFLHDMRVYLDTVPYLNFTFVVWLAEENDCIGRFKNVILLFMVSENTKLVYDVLSVSISHRLYKWDSFNTKDVMDLVLSVKIKAK